MANAKAIVDLAVRSDIEFKLARRNVFGAVWPATAGRINPPGDSSKRGVWVERRSQFGIEIRSVDRCKDRGVVNRQQFLEIVHFG